MADVDSTIQNVVIPEKQSRRQRKKAKGQSRAQRFKEKQGPQIRTDHRVIVKDNENLVKYYTRQPILAENDFDTFMGCLRESLPASFRINTFDWGQANFLKQLIKGPQLQEYITSSKIQDDENNVDDLPSSSEAERVTTDRKPAILQPLSWYPMEFGWQMNISRVDLKKSSILQQFHKFMMAETDNGFISRQESVSMIPPLVLDVHRGQSILDMCAAPGSKTAQLLEYLKHNIHNSGEQEKGDSDDLFDDGMVVANDVDNKRCYMLVHQSSRLNSPNCVIINQDAARLPIMKTFDKDGDEYVDLKFDRILCDVPCSGDGTVRKNPDVWKKWSVGNANNFHGMQIKIARRGIELLKKDGLLVYSTCSMNPVEDEAVISSILRASEGKVILEEISHKLPGLKYRPGVSKWVVMNKDMLEIPSLDKVPPESVTQVYPSLFPPTEDEAAKFNLEKCIRILPHFQNTGGFFVAVLRKLTDKLPWETSIESQNHDSSRLCQPNPKKRRFAGFKEDPFVFMEESDTDWANIKVVYGLSDDFPVTQLAHRCQSGRKRSLYLISKKTRKFMIANREEPGRQYFVKIINSGMRLFTRADTESGFRICQDGVAEIAPYIKDDLKVPMDKSDLVALLKTRSAGIDSLSAGQHIRDKIKQGSFILIYKHENDAGESTELPLVAWKGEFTVSLYVSNTYRVHLCALAELRIVEAANTDKQPETKQESEQTTKQ